MRENATNFGRLSEETWTIRMHEHKRLLMVTNVKHTPLLREWSNITYGRLALINMWTPQ
jgi:hypothetical protein